MAIRSKDLHGYMKPMTFLNGEGVTLEKMQEALGNVANEHEFSIAFRTDEISYGLLSASQDCLIIYHPEYPRSYFNFCLYIKRQGKAAIVSVDIFGKSTQINKAEFSKVKTGPSALNLLGGAAGVGFFVGRSITSGIKKGINLIGKSNSKLEEEKNWYACMNGLFDYVID